MQKLPTLVVSTLFALGLSTTAQASLITLTNPALESDRQTGTISYAGSSSNSYAGELRFDYTGDGSYGFDFGTLNSFCIEPNINVRAPAVYEVHFGMHGFSNPQQTLIAGLYDNYFQLARDTSNTAAFQLVLWEIVTDGDELDFTSGVFQASGSFGGRRTIATTWLDELSAWYASLDTSTPYRSGTYEFFTMTSALSQNQLMVREAQKVPEPGVLALLGIGLLAGVVGRVRGSRRRTAS